MTNLEFQQACGEKLLDINLVLENEKIVQALKNRDDEKVLQLLDEEF